MSGLVGKFRSFLGGGRTADENVANPMSSSEHRDRDSLSSCGSVVDQEDKSVANEQRGRNGGAMPMIKQEEDGEAPKKKDLSMAQIWRQENASAMERFICQRRQTKTFPPPSPSATSEEEEDEDEGGEEDEEEESPLDTQENAPHAKAHPPSPSQSEAELSPLLNTQPSSLPPNHPHDMPGTQHRSLYAKSVQDLSLSTKTFHLPLCRVNYFFGELRKTDRMHRQDVYSHLNPHPPKPPPADQTYKSWEYDGPLAPFYKEVLSIEVTDLTTKHSKTRRLRIFFYREYALKMAQLFEQFHKSAAARGSPSDDDGGGGLLFSFQNIPHVCIFPYAPHSSSSSKNKSFSLLDSLDYTQQGRLSKYCLCIGDKTNTLSFNPQHPEKLSFDTGGLQVCALVMNNNSSSSNNNNDTETKSHQIIVLDAHTVKQQHWCFDTPNTNASDDDEEEDSISGEAYEIACQYIQQLKQKQEKKNRKRKAHEFEEEDRATVTSDRRCSSNAKGGSGHTQPPPAAASAATTISSPATATAASNIVQNVPRNDKPAAPSSPTSHIQPGNRRHKRQRLSLTYHKLEDLPSFFDEIKQKKQRIQSGEIPFQTIKDEVNIYGTVLGFSPPTLTKRADWSMNITLMDESLSTNTTAISLVVFHGVKDKLPKIKIAGDVLRAHRVVVQEFQGKVQLLGRRHSSFVVMRPTKKSETASIDHQTASSFSTDAWDVLPTASKSFSFSQNDGDRASSLWNWAQQRIISHPTINTPMRFTISQMGAHDDNDDAQRQQQIYTTVNGDMTVFVTAIIPVPSNRQHHVALPRGFLRVWDGTGPPHSDPLPTALIAKDPPSEVLVAISDILRDNNATANQNNVGNESINDTNAQNNGNETLEETNIPPPKCLCGRVINVAVWEGAHWGLVQDKNSFIGVGAPIRLRNVSDGRLPSGLRCLMVHSKSAMTPLPKRTFEVTSLLKEHHSRIVRGEPYNPQSAVLPLHVGTDHDESAGTSEEELAPPPSQPEPTQTVKERPSSLSTNKMLTNLSECLSGPVPASFVSRFQIERTYPLFDEKSAEGMKALCVQGEDSGMMQFQFAFHLRDNDAELDAIVSNEVAEALFGITAVDVCAGNSLNDCTSTTVMTKASEVGVRKLTKILNSTCQGKIRSICVEGAKYFILDALAVDQS